MSCKIVLVGAVESTKRVFYEMLKADMPPACVFGLSEGVSEKVSGYINLAKITTENNIDFVAFTKINDVEIIKKLKEIKPDYIFVMGLSQLISDEFISCAKCFCVGLHPTKLPEYRGRGAIPWLITLGVKESALTIFKIDSGMDSGDILYQQPYYISDTDYAMDVHEKVEEAIEIAISKVLLQIKNNSLKLTVQNDNEATYTLLRTPDDGKINWQKTAKEIHTLIRATSKPYPGAFCNYKGNKLNIWKAELIDNNIYFGFNGQIAKIDNDGCPYIYLDDKLLRLVDFEFEDEDKKFIIGHKMT